MDYEKAYKTLKEKIEQRYAYNKNRHKQVRDGSYREGTFCGRHHEAYFLKTFMEEMELQISLDEIFS